MSNQDLLRFCPHCGREGLVLHADGAVRCDACSFVLFINVATAVGAIIADEQGRILLLRRSHDPAKGKLGIPGGFLSPGESAEDALIREVKEETNLQIKSYRYLGSYPNQYPYRQFVYTTADLFYACTVECWASLKAMNEVDSCVLLEPQAIQESELAFGSVAKALHAYLASLNGRP